MSGVDGLKMVHPDELVLFGLHPLKKRNNVGYSGYIDGVRLQSSHVATGSNIYIGISNC